MVTTRALTPEMVAAELSCSPSTVRKMVNTGQLRGFRLGGRLLRTEHAALEDDKCSATNASADSGRSSQSAISTTLDSAAASRLARLTVIKPNGS